MLHVLAAQLRADGKLQLSCYGIQAVDGDCVREVYGSARECSGMFKDDLIGQVLKDNVVVEAHKKELEFF